MHVFRTDPILPKGRNMKHRIQANFKKSVYNETRNQDFTRLYSHLTKWTILQEIRSVIVCIQHKVKYPPDSWCVILPIRLLSNYILWQLCSSLSSSVCCADWGEFRNRSSLPSVILISVPSLSHFYAPFFILLPKSVSTQWIHWGGEKGSSWALGGCFIKILS